MVNVGKYTIQKFYEKNGTLDPSACSFQNFSSGAQMDLRLDFQGFPSPLFQLKLSDQRAIFIKDTNLTCWKNRGFKRKNDHQKYLRKKKLYSKKTSFQRIDFHV